VIELNKEWNLRVAWAEVCSGSGWRNEIIYAVVSRAGVNQPELIVLQSDEQTEEIRVLFDVSAVVAQDMTRLAADAVRQKLEAAGGCTVCTCGKTLPLHLLGLNITKHVCSCGKEYRDEGEVFVCRGMGFNPSTGMGDPEKRKVK